jgi:hypothetical protein
MEARLLFRLAQPLCRPDLGPRGRTAALFWYALTATSGEGIEHVSSITEKERKHHH